ncbi:MAG: hypothetical protein JO093_07525 [Acidobacteria bacterium]|nr:hypothetical protein [Acidobacteriota bacterium]MBV9070089.1 hypothetical protein [Acidobacteriota bacterium]MBV9185454.1 hypothetical protein [Acidobacteriota bacterium]
MRRISLMVLTVAAMITTSAFAQQHTRNLAFASDFQTVPVVANIAGIGGNFQSYVAIYNPTSSAFSVTAALYDANGTKRTALIPLAAGELKTYNNFLDAVFNGFTGAGAVTFSSPDTSGGTRNNRFIVNTEVRTAGTRYSTPIPVLEFAGSSSRSFAPGITVDSNTRTNIGCFDQSGAANSVKATILDNTGTQTIGTVTINLAANGWRQTGVNSIVSNGNVQFDPTDSAVCYAVVVDNATNDGRFIAAAEYKP